MPFGAFRNGGGDGGCFSGKQRKNRPDEQSAVTQSRAESVVGSSADAAESQGAELDEDRLAECVSTFNTFDYDSDGRISMKELGNIMRCLGYAMTRGELKQMFTSVDRNHNGFIDLQEFLGIVSRRQRKERLETDRQLARAFRVFDADRDGFISPAELRAALRRLMRPAEVTDRLVDEMLRGADTDGDGRVSFAEFVSIVTMR